MLLPGIWSWEAVSCASRKRPYLTGDSILDAYWQTLSTDWRRDSFEDITVQFHHWNAYILEESELQTSSLSISRAAFFVALL
jgi:hypothetical protein